jgi:hypothetical protein
MTIDERARHELFLAAERIARPPPDGDLMELLPPVGWAEVATKHDLAPRRAVSLRFDLVTRSSTWSISGSRLDCGSDRRSTWSISGSRPRTRYSGSRALRRHRLVRYGRPEVRHQTAYLLGELDRRFNAQTRTLFLSLAG